MENDVKIYEYVRDRYGRKRGIVCAIGKNEIGWSFCNTTAGDRFNKNFGLMIAEGRAKKNVFEWLDTIPVEVMPVLEKMKDRAERYFK